MNPLINACLLLFLHLPAAVPPAEPESACRAELEGRLVATTIEFHEGYRLEAPWKVVNTATRQVSARRRSFTAEARCSSVTRARRAGSAEPRPPPPGRRA